MVKSTLKMRVTKKTLRVDEDGQPGWLPRVLTYFVLFFVAPVCVMFFIKSPYERYAEGKVQCRYFGSFITSTGVYHNKIWEGPSKMTTSEMTGNINSGDVLISAREMECKNARWK